MKILVVGASGFIGGHLSAALVLAGHEVVAAVRDPDRTQRRFPSVRALRMDFNDLPTPDDWAPHLRDVACVINCAGLLTERRDESLEAVNERGPISLFDACVGNGVGKVIQISAESVDSDSEFARTKRRADDYLQGLELDWTILRPSLVHARDSRGATAMLRGLATCPLLTPIPGRDGRKYQPIHVDDLCATVLQAIGEPALRGEILYPCGPDTLTLRDLVEGYRRWFGLAARRVVVLPRFVVRLATVIGDRLGSGPFTSASMIQLRNGDQADAESFRGRSGVQPRAFWTSLAGEPCGVADMWHARFYLLRPVLFAVLVAFWMIGGAIGVVIPAKETAPYLFDAGLSDAVATLLRKGLAMADIGIALLILSRGSPRWAFFAQLAAVVAHTLLVTLAEPVLWQDMSGPLIRNLPLLALIVVHRILEDESGDIGNFR